LAHHDDDDGLIASPDDEISWLALQAGTKVLTSDGKVVGHVTHVLGDLSEDIFDGIGVRHGLLGQRMLPRSAIARITRATVYLAVPESGLGEVLQAYAEERMYSAREGRKKLRWSKDEDDERY
jgi:rRNA processing protein Gar1